jgi:hypothetical protein
LLRLQEFTMPSAVPPLILLTKERAGSFRRCLEILHAAGCETPSCYDLKDTLVFLDELVLNRSGRVTLDTPLITLEWALAWANRNPPPPVHVLREARAVLQQAAEDWARSFLLVQEMSKRPVEHYPQRWPEWLAEITRGVAAEKRRIDLILEESWPVSEEETEQQALAELKSGQGLELDDAFAQIAGVSKDEWERRVAEHKSRK